MAVELKYNNEVTDVSPTDIPTLIEELDSLDGSNSSTSGTYDVAFIRYQYPDAESESRCHIHVSLRDADDADYPHVMDDLRDTIDTLSVYFGTTDEIESEISGEIK